MVEPDFICGRAEIKWFSAVMKETRKHQARRRSEGVFKKFGIRERSEGTKETSNKSTRHLTHLSSQVMSRGQVFEPEQAVPVAGPAATGVVLHHLRQEGSAEKKKRSTPSTAHLCMCSSRLSPQTTNLTNCCSRVQETSVSIVY